MHLKYFQAKVLLGVCLAFVAIGAATIQGGTTDNSDNTAGSLNTRGWEDSPFLSSDGTQLYFMYTPWQVWPVFFGRSPVLAGPERLGHHINPDRNPWEDSDVYVSTRDASGRFGVPVNAGFNDEEGDCCAMTWANGQFAYQRTQWANSALTDIYFVRRVNGNWTRQSAGAAVNRADSSESNPHVTRDGRLLFFTSDRPGGFGKNDLYVSTRDAAGNWGPAVNLGPAINTAESEDQAWISRDQQTMYFNREPGPQVLTAQRSGSGWTTPVEVLFGSQHVSGAEVSISDDGKTLVFATVRPDLEDILLVQATRLPDGTWSAPAALERR